MRQLLSSFSEEVEKEAVEILQWIEAWLEINPNTKGKNKTWTLRFNRYSGKSKDEHKELGCDFFTKWAEYRRKGEGWSKESS